MQISRFPAHFERLTQLFEPFCPSRDLARKVAQATGCLLVVCIPVAVLCYSLSHLISKISNLKKQPDTSEDLNIIGAERESDDKKANRRPENNRIDEDSKEEGDVKAEVGIDESPESGILNLETVDLESKVLTRLSSDPNSWKDEDFINQYDEFIKSAYQTSNRAFLTIKHEISQLDRNGDSFNIDSFFEKNPSLWFEYLILSKAFYSARCCLRSRQTFSSQKVKGSSDTKLCFDQTINTRFTFPLIKRGFDQIDHVKKFYEEGDSPQRRWFRLYQEFSQQVKAVGDCFLLEPYPKIDSKLSFSKKKKDDTLKIPEQVVKLFNPNPINPRKTGKKKDRNH